MKNKKIPHYTCRKKEQTGLTCILCLMDYYKNRKINERKPEDVTNKVEKIKKFILNNNPEQRLNNYDLINHAMNNGYKAEHYVMKTTNGFKKEMCMKKGMKETLTNNMREKLLELLKKGPVMTLMNSNMLYKRLDAGISWIIIVEHNSLKNEFIIYDPTYYMEVPLGKNYKRIPNTPKKRFMSVRKHGFYYCWEGVRKTGILEPEIIKIYV